MPQPQQGAVREVADALPAPAGIPPISPQPLKPLPAQPPPESRPERGPPGPSVLLPPATETVVTLDRLILTLEVTAGGDADSLDRMPPLPEEPTQGQREEFPGRAALTPAGAEPTPGVRPAPVASLDESGDEALAEVAKRSKPRIVVIGCGGGGSNTVDRCLEEGIDGVELCAINTDLAHLLSIRAHRKILLGRHSTRGRGAGSHPEVGLNATLETEEELRTFLHGAQLAFVTAGLGGGTGTGSAPTVARLAKEEGALTVGVVTLPFEGEGAVRWEVAVEGLAQLRRACDTTVVVENDRLLHDGPRLHLSAALKVADSVLATAMKGIAETVTRAGLVNLDFADVRTIMQDGGVALVGMGKTDRGSDRAAAAVTLALNSPLLGPVDLSQAKGALVHVIGPPEMTIHEAQRAAQVVAEKVPKHSPLLWGCTIDRSRTAVEKGLVQVLLIVTGVRPVGFHRHRVAEAGAPRPAAAEDRPTALPPSSPMVAPTSDAPRIRRGSIAERVGRLLRRRAGARG